MGFGKLAGVSVGDGFPVRLVGAINVSPESFYGGSVAQNTEALLELAKRMVDEGADILDIGAMSTAPYLVTEITEDEETRRMTAAISALRDTVGVPLSADTKRAAVAAAALAAGASIINDVGGLRNDPHMAAVAAEAGGVILMASETQPTHQPVVQMIMRLFRQTLEIARRAGIAEGRIVLDPGVGFYRRAAVPWDEVDCLVIRELGQFRAFGRPLMIGASRKSFIGKVTGEENPADRLWGSLGATAVGVYNGAALVRTHDVGATRDAVRVAERLRG